jgi:hypothetical protein
LRFISDELLRVLLLFVFEIAAEAPHLEAAASWPARVSNGQQARDVFEHLARSSVTGGARFHVTSPNGDGVAPARGAVSEAGSGFQNDQVSENE